MEGNPESLEPVLLPTVVDGVGEQRHHQLPLWIDPQGGSGEAGVAEGAGAERVAAGQGIRGAQGKPQTPALVTAVGIPLPRQLLAGHFPHRLRLQQGSRQKTLPKAATSSAVANSPAWPAIPPRRAAFSS